jgi:hypothetical protein
MGDQNLLSRAPPCFGRHDKLLVPTAFAVVSTHSNIKEGLSQAGGGGKIVAESLSQNDEKYVVPTPLRTWDKGRKKKKIIFVKNLLAYVQICYLIIYDCYSFELYVLLNFLKTK